MYASHRLKQSQMVAQNSLCLSLAKSRGQKVCVCGSAVIHGQRSLYQIRVLVCVCVALYVIHCKDHFRNTYYVMGTGCSLWGSMHSPVRRRGVFGLGLCLGLSCELILGYVQGNGKGQAIEINKKLIKVNARSL